MAERTSCSGSDSVAPLGSWYDETLSVTVCHGYRDGHIAIGVIRRQGVFQSAKRTILYSDLLRALRAQIGDSVIVEER